MDVLSRKRIGPKTAETILRFTVLILAAITAFAVRLFSVVRYEAVIHEFDPYFNYRATRVLVDKGLYDFWNWFDDTSWYPLGRDVGGTVYAGTMYSAAFVYWALHALGFQVDIRDVCVFVSPLWASFTTIVTYAFTKELTEGRDSVAGLFAAAFVAVVPGYISRSSAGAFDNECVAIFALMNTFYLFVKSVNTGSLLWAISCCLAYLYMVACWGGYIFIINLIPIYVVVMILAGRYSHRLYVAYSTFYVIGTLLSMQIRFVGFQAVQSAEHMIAAVVFLSLQVYCLGQWVRSLTSENIYRAFVRYFAITVGTALAFLGAVLFLTGYIQPWTGRFYTLLDPTYASKHIPIIASVSEHQPTAWASYFFDLHILTVLAPLGLYYCFQKVTDAGLFVILYFVFAVYFSGVMVRLILVLAPAACAMGAIGISRLLQSFGADLKRELMERKWASFLTGMGLQNGASIETSSSVASSSGRNNHGALRMEVPLAILIGALLLGSSYVRHCTWVASEAYSSPSIVLAGYGPSGRFLIDDFREAYYWLGSNAPADAKIVSWWDYGYQIAGMGFRTTIVDNNTWNFTHIATVGALLSQPEQRAHDIARMLDADYVLVIFGGLIGYSGDDINKFLWPVRIGGSVDPSIQESQFLSRRGDFRLDADIAPAMRESLLYKLCYYRYGEISGGYDRARGYQIPHLDIRLTLFEEAFTSEHWIVRIYRVKPPNNRGNVIG
jgi:dolichyl-diphosphooligosaccharide--protein glycosyltransferase